LLVRVVVKCPVGTQRDDDSWILIPYGTSKQKCESGDDY